MFISFLFVPITAPTLLIGFLLFRLFDILKPWPIGVVDKRMHGGTGIMLDDIIAGIMTCVCMHLVIHLWPAVLLIF
ncbi:MAG TPA: phosphatidylglycerophosphatase A, partial [Alteromonas australica]|nr:phosphatidylglycerophosphatase A [Alteromonas australica]